MSISQISGYESENEKLNQQFNLIKRNNFGYLPDIIQYTVREGRSTRLNVRELCIDERAIFKMNVT